MPGPEVVIITPEQPLNMGFECLLPSVRAEMHPGYMLCRATQKIMHGSWLHQPIGLDYRIGQDFAMIMNNKYECHHHQCKVKG